MTTQQTPTSGLEFVSEVSDLAARARMLEFALAPFALAVVALTVLAALVPLIPELGRSAVPAELGHMAAAAALSAGEAG